MRKGIARRRLALAAVVVGAAAPAVRRRLRLPAPLTSLLAWQAPLALTIAFPRSRIRDAGVYVLQMWAYVAHYELPNDDPARLRERLRIDYPIRADRAIGLGVVPTVRLQRLLGPPTDFEPATVTEARGAAAAPGDPSEGPRGEVRAHDTVLSCIHWSWFFVPHVAVAYVLVRDRPAFAGAAGQMAAVFDLGVVAYFVVPTAPPWWAARYGHLEPVRRIMSEAGERFWGRLWVPLYDSLSGNQFAAMPSLHFATSVMGAHVLSDTDRAAGVAGWAYAGVLGFALVYLGEHYLVDLAAGLVLAESVRRLAPIAAPKLELARRALARLEPRARS